MTDQTIVIRPTPARVVITAPAAGPPGPSGVVIVNHGTDPNVARPDAPVVYWKGTATPANAAATDWWLNV